ncbi:MAG: carbon-nitrogen family hydrolase [Anaerolineales bacterium]|nr:carbon-nitrogen family hydrolase [Anaerolineales bacterium]
MTALTIAVGQMDVSLGDPEVNLARVADLAAAAAARSADWLVLPELWSTGYDLENAGRHATTTDQGIFAQTAVLARTHRLHIIGSCLSWLGDGRYGNTAVFWDDHGRILVEYSKIHLFRLMDEHQYLTGGDRLAQVETAWGQVGLSICYDLRFPELFRAYALSGVRLVVIPAEWPHPRLAHWQTLLRARAIENQMFVVACNRVGRTGSTEFCGHSAIIDPWGEALVEGGESEELLVATIDLDQVEAVRRKIPIFSDRRPHLYQTQTAV